MSCTRSTLPVGTQDTFTLAIRISATAPDGARILGAPVLTTVPSVADVQNTFAVLDATVSRPGAPVRTVTDCGDTGVAGQLRQTVAAAGPGDTVLLSGCPLIAVTAGELVIDKDLALQGAGPGLTVLDAGGTSRVLRVTVGNVALTGLTLRNGNSGAVSAFDGTAGGVSVVGGMVTLRNAEIRDSQGGNGGGIFSSGALTLDRSVVSANRGFQGGGVSVQGPTLVTDSTLTGNSVTGIFSGGALAADLGSVTVVRNSTLSGNASEAFAGAIIAGTPITVSNATIVGNSAGLGGGAIGADGIALRNTIVAGNTAPADPNCTGPAISSPSGRRPLPSCSERL